MQQPSLFVVPASHIGQAWRDGAHNLAEACDRAAGEVTGSQLRLMLSRGEKLLIGIRDAAAPAALPAGWLAVSIDQLPNLRALYVYAIYAPGATGPACIALLRQFAAEQGCEVLRGACGPAVQRLWERRFKARPIYTICEISLEESTS